MMSQTEMDLPNMSPANKKLECFMIYIEVNFSLYLAKSNFSTPNNKLN